MFLFRTAFLTLLFAALGMALGLFIGIFYIIISSALTHTPADLTRAYHSIAIPTAVVFAAGALLWNLGGGIYRAVRK